MSVLDQLNEDLKTAMKSKDKLRLGVIRGLKSEIMNAQVKNGKEKLTDDQLNTVVLKEIKQEKESISEFQKGGRDDLVADQKSKLAVAQEYAPKQMSEDEVKKVVEDTIAQVGATSKAQFGKVMGAVMSKVKGKADGSVVNKFVKELLK